jgi:uncharacterized protein with HEPN domain
LLRVSSGIYCSSEPGGLSPGSAFRSAVERELQIIGEALMQLQKVAPEQASSIDEHQRIIRFRHVIVHGYDELDPAAIWNVIEHKLPKLRHQVRAILPDQGEC